MNNVNLIGRLTADPELRQTTNGTASCRFTVAVNRQFKNANGEYEADFVNCTAWKNTAEFVSRYFSKGSMIALSGEIRNNNYEKDGVKHYSYIVNVNNVEFCGSKSDSTASASQPQQKTMQQETQSKASDIAYGDLSEFEEIIGDDDIPF